MQLQLHNWRVTHLKFEVSDKSTMPEDGKFNISHSNSFPQNEEEKVFAVNFRLHLENHTFDLDLQMSFFFLLDAPITKEFIQSSFPKVNAPAIAFPYIRAYISNLTLQSGLEPIILPSINFIKLAEEGKDV